MSKTFAAALLCATTFAIKMKTRETGEDLPGTFNIHEETWGDVCEYIEAGHEIDWDMYYDEADTNGDGTLNLEEFLVQEHEMTEEEEAFYSHHGEYVYNILAGYDGHEGLTKEEMHEAFVCDYGIPKALFAFRWADYADNGEYDMHPEEVAHEFAHEVNMGFNEYEDMLHELEEEAVDGVVHFDDFWAAMPWAEELCSW